MSQLNDLDEDYESPYICGKCHKHGEIHPEFEYGILTYFVVCNHCGYYVGASTEEEAVRLFERGL